jgi:hypothetical protein
MEMVSKPRVIYSSVSVGLMTLRKKNSETNGILVIKLMPRGRSALGQTFSFRIMQIIGLDLDADSAPGRMLDKFPFHPQLPDSGREARTGGVSYVWLSRTG